MVNAKASEQPPMARAALDEKKLASGILSLISQFFAKGRQLSVEDQNCVVISSDDTPSDTEAFIDVRGGSDDPEKVIGKYAILLQKTSR
jgi:hypothetical protein